MDVVLVGDNKITVTAPYGNKAINAYNVSMLTFKGSGSLTIDFQVTNPTNQVYMYGIYMDGDASSHNNGNLVFDESCTVTVNVYGEVAEKNGLVDAIYMTDAVIGTEAFDNTVTWSVEGGGENTKISDSGVLTIAENGNASTLTIKAVANGDESKFASKTLEIYSKVTIKQGSSSNDLYQKAGETVSLTAIVAPSGYHFTGWTKTGKGIFADSTAETDFTVSTSNVTI